MNTDCVPYPEGVVQAPATSGGVGGVCTLQTFQEEEKIDSLVSVLREKGILLLNSEGQRALAVQACSAGLTGQDVLDAWEYLSTSVSESTDRGKLCGYLVSRMRDPAVMAKGMPDVREWLRKHRPRDSGDWLDQYPGGSIMRDNKRRAREQAEAWHAYVASRKAGASGPDQDHGKS